MCHSSRKRSKVLIDVVVDKVPNQVRGLDLFLLHTFLRPGLAVPFPCSAHPPFPPSVQAKELSEVMAAWQGLCAFQVPLFHIDRGVIIHKVD